MSGTEENRTDEVLNKMVNLSVKDDKVEEEFEKDCGSRLRLAKGALLIQEIGNRVHCTFITVTKAMVLFHKVKRNPKFNTSCLASVACLNLAIKLSEEDVTPDEMVLKSYHAILDLENAPNPDRPDPTSEEHNDMKKNLCLAEYAICRSFSFNLECPIAHVYVYKFLLQLQAITDVSEGIMVSMSTTVTKLLNTYYMCDGCLDYTAYEIACACIQFAYLFCGAVSTSIRVHLKKEIMSIPKELKDKIGGIVDEMVLVSDVATTLKYI